MKMMRVAACMHSFGRLYELHRQVYAMMDQSYKNLHLFVAVKGFTEDLYKEVILPPIQHFIDEGRLTMRLFPNSNQLTNFVDTVRDLNINEYDLFFKIDDDDFYHRDYVKTVVELLDKHPVNMSSGHVGISRCVVRADDILALGQFDYNQIAGVSVVLSPPCVKRIIEVEADPEKLKEEIKTWKGSSATPDIGWSEDRYFAYLATATGVVLYANAFKEKGIIPYHVGWMDARNSVSRSGLKHTEFGVKMRTVARVGKEWFATDSGVISTFDGDAVICTGNKKNTKGKVIEKDANNMSIEWPSPLGKVTYRRNKDTGKWTST